jgi:hypothetical protein
LLQFVEADERIFLPRVLIHRGFIFQMTKFNCAATGERPAWERNITAFRTCGPFLRRNEDTEALPRNQV